MRIIFLFLLLYPIQSTAQQTFMKNYGGDKFDRALFITHTKDKGYMACGYSNSFGTSHDMFIVKIDKAGNQQWQKHYGGAKMELGWTVLELKNGYLLHGSTLSKDTTNQDIYLLRLDQLGNIIWEKTYGNKNEERTTDVLVDSDGNYLLIGHRVIKDTTDTDSYLIKIDTAGNIIWEKTFGGPMRERAFYGDETKQGDYLISGSILPYQSSKADLLFLRVSKKGELIWSKSHGAEHVHDISHSFRKNKDRKTFTATGYIESSNPGFHNAYFLQVDQNGSVFRHKVHNTGEDLRIMHAEQTDDGGFIATGFTRPDITKNIWDAVLLKYDAKGDVEWMKTFGTPELDDQGYWVVCNDDGGYTFTGYTHSHGKGGDLWVIRTNSKGEVE